MNFLFLFSCFLFLVFGGRRLTALERIQGRCTWSLGSPLPLGEGPGAGLLSSEFIELCLEVLSKNHLSKVNRLVNVLQQKVDR